MNLIAGTVTESEAGPVIDAGANLTLPISPSAAARPGAEVVYACGRSTSGSETGKPGFPPR